MKFIRKNNLGEDEYYIRYLNRYGTKEEVDVYARKIEAYAEHCLRKQLSQYDK